MKPLNIFNYSLQDFDNIIGIQNQFVYINGKSTNAVITTAGFRKAEFKKPNEKHISTKTPIHCGDIVFYDNRYWIINNQSDVKRYESYKGNMQLIEHDVIFNLKQGMTQPPTNFLIKAPVLITSTADAILAFASNIQMETIDGEIHIQLQENSVTKNLIHLRGKKGRVIFGGCAWEVIHVSFVQKGLLDVTCRITTKNASDNIDLGVSGATQSDLDKFLDTSMYNIETSTHPDPEPEMKLPEVNVLTDVTLTAYNPATRTIYFTRDKNHDKYLGFTGYHIIVTMVVGLWGDDEIVYDKIINDVSEMPSFVMNKDINTDDTWTVKIAGIYSDGFKTVEIISKEFDGERQINKLPQNP